MTIHIRTCDDWVALYKDGRKVEENHSLTPRMTLEALGIEFTYEDIDELMDNDLGSLKNGGDPFPEVLHAS